MKWRLALCVTLALAGCDYLPRDPAGTLERVQREGRFRVGLISPGETAVDREAERGLLIRVAEAAGAQPAVELGASEALLLELEEGRLDLVLGPLSKDSPWLGRVALLEPIGGPLATEELAITPAARNGENRWIMLVEREVRAMSKGAGA